MSGHEQAAAYALDALDDEERRAFDEHLAHCAICAEEVESLKAAAAALAFAGELPPAPTGLRARILERAVAERAVVVPLRRRLALPALAAAGGAAAIALGIWAATLSSSLDHERSARRAEARALAILAAADSRRLSLTGADGTLVVSPSGAAALVVRHLPPAPPGKTYEIWVVKGSAQPVPAGLFHGGGVAVVALTHPVSDGALVAVTVEPARGSTEPTGRLLLKTESA